MNDRDHNTQLVRRFVRAGNERDFETLESIVDPTFERHCPATPDVVVRSFDDLRRFLERDAKTFPDNRVTLRELVAEGDRVAFWATYAGTQAGPMGPFPPSGRRLELEFAGMFTIRDDRIAHLRLTWDNLSALIQLGHLPPSDEPDSGEEAHG